MVPPRIGGFEQPVGAEDEGAAGGDGEAEVRRTSAAGPGRAAGRGGRSPRPRRRGRAAAGRGGRRCRAVASPVRGSSRTRAREVKLRWAPPRRITRSTSLQHRGGHLRGGDRAGQRGGGHRLDDGAGVAVAGHVAGGDPEVAVLVGHEIVEVAAGLGREDRATAISHPSIVGQASGSSSRCIRARRSIS